MSRFYFNLTDGVQTLKSPKGVELAGNAAARDEGLRLARDLKHGRSMPGRDWSGWFVAVLDQQLREIDRIPIDVVPDAPNPPVT